MNLNWSSIRDNVPDKGVFRKWYGIETPFKIYTDFKTKFRRLYNKPNSIE